MSFTSHHHSPSFLSSPSHIPSPRQSMEFQIPPPLNHVQARSGCSRRGIDVTGWKKPVMLKEHENIHGYPLAEVISYIMPMLIASRALSALCTSTSAYVRDPVQCKRYPGVMQNACPGAGIPHPVMNRLIAWGFAAATFSSLPERIRVEGRKCPASVR